MNRFFADVIMIGIQAGDPALSGWEPTPYSDATPLIVGRAEHHSLGVIGGKYVFGSMGLIAGALKVVLEIVAAQYDTL